jgi:hypothetical protein
VPHKTPAASRRRYGSLIVTLVAFLATASWWLPLRAEQGRTTQPQVQGVPRTADGKPDFTGIWQVMNTADRNIQDHVGEKGAAAGRGIVEGNEIPYRPEALRKKQENFRNRDAADPNTKCWMPGVPRIMYMPYPFQIAQGPKQISILFEYIHGIRNVFMEGPHIRGPLDLWLGDSRGRWDGDTLVVDVVDFNDETWFDHSGNFHSDALHVIERYTLTGPDHIQYDVTIEDPKVFTRPWKMSTILYRHKEKDVQLFEYECFAYQDAERHPSGESTR